MVKGCEHVFNLAADMGGMGFIQARAGQCDPPGDQREARHMHKKADEAPPPALLSPMLAARQSNHSTIMYNNTMISINMLEAARLNGVTRFFYASSACIYPEYKQLEVRHLLPFLSS